MEETMNSIQERAEICAGLTRFRQAKNDFTPVVDLCSEIVNSLEQFMECVRYLNTRRSSGAKLSLVSEEAVQDAIYLMLRPWVKDLVYENPTDKIGNRFVIKDFISKSAKSVIEAKYIRSESHGKQIAKELHDDIETYRHHPSCENIIFFIYDPESLIPDSSALHREITDKRTYNGKTLNCYLIIRP